MRILENNTFVTYDNINDGDTYQWRADDTLDSGVVVMINENKKPFEPFTLCEIDFESETDQMYIASDKTQNYGKASSTYQHTLELVELTKILEKIYPCDCYMLSTATQSLKLELQRFVYNFNETQDGDIRLVITDALNNRLQNIAPEDFAIGESTLREVLDEILSAVSCRIVVESVTANDNGDYCVLNLGYIDLNESSIGSVTDTLNIEMSNDADNYGGRIISNVSNAISPNFIRQIDTFKVKYGEAAANTDNRIMSLAYGIEYPTDFKIQYIGQIKYKYYFQAPNDSRYVEAYYNVSADFTDAISNFVDKEYWDTLVSTEQEKMLYYQRGVSEIDVSRTYKHLLITKTTFSAFITAIYRQYFIDNWDTINPVTQAGATGTFVSIIDNSYSINNVIYDLTYQARVDCYVAAYKNTIANGNQISIIDNQTDNIIDIERYGKNLGGKIKRLGNNSLYIDVNAYSYADILPLFAKVTQDGIKYIVYEVDFSRHIVNSTTFYEVRYYLSENYNNLNERIGVRREKRIYAIPLQGYKKTIIRQRNILVGTWARISSKIDATKTLAYNANIPYMFVQTLATSPNTAVRIINKKIENAKIAIVGGATIGEDYFVQPVDCHGAGNTLNITTKMYDNYSAGLSITDRHNIFDTIGGKKVVYNEYVDANGNNVGSVVGIGYYTGTRTTAGILAQPKYTSGEAFYNLDNIQNSYVKDASESLLWQIIYNLYVNKTDSIIITDRLCGRNIATNGNDIDLYIWYNTDTYKYKEGDTKCVGTKIGKVSLFSTIVSKMQEVNGITIPIAYGLYVNWSGGADYTPNFAIGDTNGNLYMAVNYQMTDASDAIYFGYTK